MNKIHPRLCIRGHTRNIPTERVVETLREYGVRYLLNVSPRIDEDVETAIEQLGWRYRHCPMSDGVSVPRNIWEIAAQVADAMRYTPVLIHCNAGRNRSVLVATLAIALYDRRKPLDVLLDIRQWRASVLANPVFEDFVRRAS